MWSDAPWYMSGSVQNSGGIVAPRARRTSSTWFTYAEPSAHWYARGSGAIAARIERRRIRAAGPAFELGGDRLERRRGALPVVERRLQRARDLGDRDAAREVARDDDELAVARAVATRRELHRDCAGRRGASSA